MSESWLQIAALFIANMGLILWFRAESRNDWRHMDNKVDALQKETSNKIDALQKETASKIDAIKDLISAIHLEVKTFNARLFSIERNNRKDRR